MHVDTYFFILLSFLFNWIVGFLITKNTVISLPIGCFFLGTLISLLIRYIPGYTLIIIKSICIVSAIIFIINSYKKKIKLKFCLEDIIYFIFILTFFLILFIKFHYRFNVYETHELAYYSPTIELYLSDYIGNIRTLTYYPSELTGHPNYPSSVMSALMIFVSDINLIKIIETRYLIICIFFTLIFIYFKKFNKTKNIYFLLFIFLIPLYFFEDFIEVALLMSAIFGLVIMYFLLITVFYENEDKKLLKIASYLSIFLCMAKPGIAFIFWIFPIFFYFKYTFIKKDPFFYIFGALVFLNYVTWFALPVPVGNVFLTLFNPLKINDYFNTFIISGWFNSKFFEILNNYYDINKGFKFVGEAHLINKVEFIKINLIKIFIDLTKILNVFIITFVLSWLLLFKVEVHNKKLIKYFLIISLIIFTFVRHENIYFNKTIEQVVYIFHFVAIVSAVLMTIYLEKFFFKLKNIFLIFLFLLNTHFSVFLGSHMMNLRTEMGNPIIKYNDFIKMEINNVINSNYFPKKNIVSKKQIIEEEIIASMLGARILRSENDKFLNDHIRPYMIQWSYPRLHSFYWFGENKILPNDYSSKKILKLNFLEK